jgi:hypothetical protein
MMRRYRRAIRLALALTVWVTSFPASAAHGEFYPARTTYDYEKYDPHNPDCLDPSNPGFDHGRCGPTDGPVFNSFINTPSYGDERAFFDGRRADQPTSANADEVLYPTEGTREVVLRAYIDNDANESYGYKETAHDTTIKVTLPTGTARVLRARALVSAPNAIPPGGVEDTVDLADHRAFRVQYVPGSAVLLRDNRSTPVSDEIVTTGAAISNTGISGEFVAGFNKSSLVELRVRIIPAGPNRWWIAVLGAVLALSGLALWPASRKRGRQVATAVLDWERDREVHVAVIANLLALGVLAALGWLIAHLL